MFGLQFLIQDLLESATTLTPEPRSEIWASDLGKPYLDRWLSMKGFPYTNPATGESLQNFLIGSAIEQGFVNLLRICMIPTASGNNGNENRVKVELPGCLPVVGRPDLIVEVKSWKEVEDRVDEYLKSEKPERQKQKKLRLLKLLDYWKAEYPDGLPKTVFEIKSISSRALAYNKNRGLLEAYPHYKLQLYTYIKAMELDEGRIIFIAKDYGKNGGVIHEYVIKRSEEMDQAFEKDVREFSHYFLNNERPPFEEIVKDGRINWRARFSSYYDLLYKDKVEEAEKQLAIEKKNNESKRVNGKTKKTRSRSRRSSI